MSDAAHEIENLLYAYAERIDAGDLEGVAGLFEHGSTTASLDVCYFRREGSATICRRLEHRAGPGLRSRRLGVVHAASFLEHESFVVLGGQF